MMTQHAYSRTGCRERGENLETVLQSHALHSDVWIHLEVHIWVIGIFMNKIGCGKGNFQSMSYLAGKVELFCEWSCPSHSKHSHWAPLIKSSFCAIYTNLHHQFHFIIYHFALDIFLQRSPLGTFDLKIRWSLTVAQEYKKDSTELGKDSVCSLQQRKKALVDCVYVCGRGRESHCFLLMDGVSLQSSFVP